MDSAEKIRGLITELNPAPVDFTDKTIFFHDPVVEEGERNTTLLVEGIPGRGYYGTQSVHYKRVALETVYRATPVRSALPLTPQLVLDLFNAASGTWLTLEDVEPFTPPVLQDGETGSVTLTAVPLSLGFTGSVVVDLEYGRSWLDAVVTSRTLRVLKHPTPVTYKLSARMLTWSKDFTSLVDAIKPNKTGDYNDWDKLQAACADMGIPTWVKGKITDQATSAVPDANPLFHRVVVQKNASSNGMVGDLYFHYNNLDEVI